MIDHERLVREAAAHDAAGALRRAAAEIERAAGKLDDLSETKLRRMAADLHVIARLERPRQPPQRAPLPGDVRDFG